MTDLLIRALTGLRHLLRHKITLGYHFRWRSDDVFVATFPKSGTTLLQMMLYQLTTAGEMDFPHLSSISPFFEELLLSGFNDPAGRAHLEQLPSPRVMKTHYHYRHVPRGAKCIYMLRDVRDVAASAYRHYCLITGSNLDREQFVDGFLNGVPYGSWFKHVASWWPHRHDANVLFLRYEEVIADLRATAERVAAFCRLPLDEPRLSRVVERCSIDFMRQHQAKFDPRLQRLGQNQESFIGKGGAGGGREALTTVQQERIARQLARLQRGLGVAAAEIYAAERGPRASAAQPASLAASSSASEWTAGSRSSE
jgi:hypothetical protein